ncbi:hypothetical protein [Pseudomonas chlororaphis]|uniref:hypothetical protein n=1 Tax=Pseudomonas chlororaphis TaxID=587753 RepID=UPI0008656C04|nr:hypothetical protein [Pseudomonas chlororaphis]AZD46463.1 hypothetical protein C4K20_1029 [Pseudomonas chlororaphis subsp. aurantiaca]BAV73061.1 hypothetical protein PCAU_0852 [Pseudomonas chlororaphis subsp. aurantiaca]
MIDRQFWYSWFGLALAVSPLLLCLVNLSFSYYLSRRYLREMLVAMQESSYFHGWIDKLPYQKWFERFLMFNSVRGMMLFPSIGIRRGFLSAENVHNFPSRLKRLLTVRNRLDVVLILWVVLIHTLLKMR